MASSYILFDRIDSQNVGKARHYAKKGFRTFFWQLSPELNNDTCLKRLEEDGVFGLAYDMLPSGFLKRIHETTENIIATVFASQFENGAALSAWKKFNVHRESESRILDTAIRSRIARRAFEVANLIYFIRVFQLNPAIQVRCHVTPDPVASRALEHYGLENEYSFRNYVWQQRIQFLFKTIPSAVKERVLRLMSRSPRVAREIDRGKNAPKVASRVFETIFFPNQGVIYGSKSALFVKDQFYCEDPQSPFHPSNILHLGLGDPLPEISREYYERHEIRHADLYSITQGCSRREIRASLLKAVGCSSVCFWLWQRFGPLGILEEVIFEAEDYYVRMAQFPAVRVVLVGYEVLFPPALALACNRLGIVTVATQERFSNAFFPADLFAVEHYFFLGEQARSMIKRRGFSWIGKEHILGPARVKNLRKAMVQSDPGKYQAIRAKQKLVLVLDFHSEPSFNENRLVDNHWEHNQRFYRDIIRLAEHFQTAHFVIKGKNADWLELDYFSSVREEIEGIGNVSVETDLREYDPARMAAITDLCIAMYNSLGDELLAIDRPVIFYDFYGMPADFYDFEKTAACATTFGELMAATTRGLQTGRVLEPRDSERIRRKCYGYENGLPSEGSHLLDTLHSIYNGPRSSSFPSSAMPQ